MIDRGSPLREAAAPSCRPCRAAGSRGFDVRSRQAAGLGTRPHKRALALEPAAPAHGDLAADRKPSAASRDVIDHVRFKTKLAGAERQLDPGSDQVEGLA